MSAKHQMMTRLIQAISFFAILFGVDFSCATEQVMVDVLVSRQKNITTYSYHVKNDADLPVVALRIGFDYPRGVSQLLTEPYGWTLEQGVPPSSVTSPLGWTPRLVTTEESEFFYMEWNNDGDSLNDIAPHGKKTGFSVRSAQPDSEYSTANFDVVLADSTHIYGQLRIDANPEQAAIYSNGTCR